MKTLIESMIVKLNEAISEHEIEYSFELDFKHYNSLMKSASFRRDIVRKIYDVKGYKYLKGGKGCIRHDDGEDFVEIKKGKAASNVFVEEKEKIKHGETELEAIHRVHRDKNIQMIGGYHTHRCEIKKHDRPFINEIVLDKVTYFDNNKKELKTHYFLEVEFKKHDSVVKEYIKEFKNKYNLKDVETKKVPLLLEYLEGKRR